MSKSLKFIPMEVRSVVVASVFTLGGVAARWIGDVAPQLQVPAYWVVVVSNSVAILMWLGIKIRDVTFGVPFFAIGIFLTFTLSNLGRLLGWETTFSGPLSTWPLYGIVAYWAWPVGAFVDFMVWAAKPRGEKATDRSAPKRDGE